MNEKENNPKQNNIATQRCKIFDKLSTTIEFLALFGILSTKAKEEQKLIR